MQNQCCSLSYCAVWELRDFNRNFEPFAVPMLFIIDGGNIRNDMHESFNWCSSLNESIC